MQTTRSEKLDLRLGAEDRGEFVRLVLDPADYVVEIGMQDCLAAVLQRQPHRIAPRLGNRTLAGLVGDDIGAKLALHREHDIGARDCGHVDREDIEDRLQLRRGERNGIDELAVRIMNGGGEDGEHRRVLSVACMGSQNETVRAPFLRNYRFAIVAQLSYKGQGEQL